MTVRFGAGAATTAQGYVTSRKRSPNIYKWLIIDNNNIQYDKVRENIFKTYENISTNEQNVLNRSSQNNMLII